jgi:hypothetical protein
VNTIHPIINGTKPINTIKPIINGKLPISSIQTVTTTKFPVNTIHPIITGTQSGSTHGGFHHHPTGRIPRAAFRHWEAMVACSSRLEVEPLRGSTRWLATRPPQPARWAASSAASFKDALQRANAVERNAGRVKLTRPAFVVALRLDVAPDRGGRYSREELSQLANGARILPAA